MSKELSLLCNIILRFTALSFPCLSFFWNKKKFFFFFVSDCFPTLNSISLCEIVILKLESRLKNMQCEQAWKKIYFYTYSNQLTKYDLIASSLIIDSPVHEQQIHCMIVLEKINPISASMETVEMEVINGKSKLRLMFTWL